MQSIKKQKENQNLKKKLVRVQSQLEETKAALDAIKRGEVDGLVVYRGKEPRVFTLQGAERSYRLFLEAMNEGALTVDKEGLILFANRHFSKMLGIPLEQIVGSSLYSFIKNIEGRDSVEILENADSQNVHLRVFLKIPRSKSIPTAFSVSSLPFENTEMKCILVTDLREQENLKAERQLRRELEISESRYRSLVNQLEIRVKKRTEELSRANVELKRSNEELETFAYVASHDLQEPLRMIRSYTQLLSYKIKLDKEGEQFMKFVTEGVKRMQALIEDLLVFSRIRSESLNFQKIDLNQMLERAKENLRTVIEESGAEIIQEDLPHVNGDASQMTQLFQNLLSNAIKFRRIETPIIHISSKKKGNEWQFAIKDNGIGIEEVYFKQIFVIFQRLHPKDKFAGTGIGLALCKKILENHHGRIWIDSQVGKGSTFYFTLPETP